MTVALHWIGVGFGLYLVIGAIVAAGTFHDEDAGPLLRIFVALAWPVVIWQARR